MDTNDIKNIIKNIIGKLVSPDKDILISEKEESFGGIRWFSIEMEDAGPFLRKEGEALASLNHLVKKILEQKSDLQEDVGSRADILIDINGFQKKRIDNIKALAHMMAERARYFKSNIEIDPMSAFDRRIVHEFLSTASDLKTESEGFGRERRVVIKYIGEI